jgi:hypothetical protein
VSDLGALFAAEQAVLAAAGSSRLPPELRALGAQAAARVAALRAAVDRGNHETVPPASGGGVRLEAALQRAIAAGYAAVQSVDDEQTLRLVGEVMAGDGQALALLRQAMNRSPVPSAFETGKAP